MDPISLVVAALVAGLSAGLTDMTKTAVGDLYTSLKLRLHQKVESHPDAHSALAEVEKKPSSAGRQDTLKEELAGLHIDQDADLVALAKSMLEQLDEPGAKAGKYNITIHNAQGTVIGDHSNVTQTFNNRRSRS